MAFQLFNRSRGDKEMSFIDHLEELRWHILRSALVIILLAIAVFVKIDWLFDRVILGPLQKDFFTYTYLCDLSHKWHMGDALCMDAINITMQANTFSQQFISSITIALTGGLIIGFPYVFWEFWRFIRPALKAKERKHATSVIFWVSFFFFLGALFGYYLLAPYTFSFLANYHLGTSGMLKTIPTLDDYIENLMDITLGSGVAFELPVASFALTKIGLITPSFLKTVRKYAYVIILVVAAVITPSPDWMSQTIVAVPLIILYELSILVSSGVVKEQKKRDEEEWS